MMKEFEFEFDDEIFEESNCGTNIVEETYKPKQCDPEWFMQFCSDGDQAEQQSIKKYQGDLLYRKHKYQEALAVYQESQHCLPPNNTVLARELLESMAMCLLKLEKFNDALVLTKQIMDNKQNNDSSIWHLLSRIYRAMGNIQGEIDALQRCATLHPWNYQYWFSLALVYERATASCLQVQDGNFSEVDLSERCFCRQINISERNCKEKPSNDKYSQETDLTNVCCKSVEKSQPAKYKKHCDSDKEKTRKNLEHLSVEDREDTSAEHFKWSSCPNSVEPDDTTGVQGHSEMISAFKKNKSNIVLSEGKQALEEKTLCNCQTTCKASVKDKLQWRNHILSFGCLLKSRFFLEKAAGASSSFVKDKCKMILTEVNDKIATHTGCGCVHVIDKVLEMLHTSVIASEQDISDQEHDARTEGYKQQENSSVGRVNSFEFEQKWFGDLLSNMS